MSQVPVHLPLHQAYASIPDCQPTLSTLRPWGGERTLLGVLLPESLPSWLLSECSGKRIIPYLTISDASHGIHGRPYRVKRFGCLSQRDGGSGLPCPLLTSWRPCRRDGRLCLEDPGGGGHRAGHPRALRHPPGADHPLSGIPLQACAAPALQDFSPFISRIHLMVCYPSMPYL